MRREHNLIPEEAEWKKKVFRIIYFAETPLGKLFDVVLLAMIVLSALIVVMDSVENIRFHKTFLVAYEHHFYGRIHSSDNGCQKQERLYIQHDGGYRLSFYPAVLYWYFYS